MQPRDTLHTQNQCIFQVIAFISNARPFIQYIKSYLSTKILFSKISFFFSKFCPILFDFILFFQRKKKFFRNLLFTIDRDRYCSQLIVDCYCSQLTIDCYCYYSPKLQYNLLCCNTILATAHPLQYNLLCCNTILATALSCNTPGCVAIQS